MRPGSLRAGVVCRRHACHRQTLGKIWLQKSTVADVCNLEYRAKLVEPRHARCQLACGAKTWCVCWLKKYKRWCCPAENEGLRQNLPTTECTCRPPSLSSYKVQHGSPSRSNSKEVGGPPGTNSNAAAVRIERQGSTHDSREKLNIYIGIFVRPPMLYHIYITLTVCLLDRTMPYNCNLARLHCGLFAAFLPPFALCRCRLQSVRPAAKRRLALVFADDCWR